MNRHLAFSTLVLLWLYVSPVPAAPALDEPYCGDGICQTEGCHPGNGGFPGSGCAEDYNECPQDCECVGCTSPCGDGLCTHDEAVSGSCPTDCGPGPSGNGTCDPGASPTGCDTNYVCGADHLCHPINQCSPINCLTKEDCCNDNICMIDPNYGPVGQCIGPPA